MSATEQYSWSKYQVWYGWTQLRDAAMHDMKDDQKSIFTISPSPFKNLEIFPDIAAL